MYIFFEVKHKGTFWRLQQKHVFYIHVHRNESLAMVLAYLDS